MREVPKVITSIIQKNSFDLVEFHSDDAEIVDDEEFQYIKRTRELKQVYRDNYDLLRSTKSEIDYLTRLVERCREKLLQDFELWYSESFIHPSNVQSPSVNNNNSHNIEQPSEKLNSKKDTTSSDDSKSIVVVEVSQTIVLQFD